MGFGHTTLKYGTLTYKSLKLKKKKNEMEAESHSEMLPPHHSPLKQFTKLPWESSRPVPRGKRTFLSP